MNWEKVPHGLRFYLGRFLRLVYRVEQIYFYGNEEEERKMKVPYHVLRFTAAPAPLYALYFRVNMAPPRSNEGSPGYPPSWPEPEAA